MSTVTDQYVLNDCIYRVLENGDADANGTVLTDMFAVSEIIDSMNRVQQSFLLATGMIVTRTTIGPPNVGKPKYDLPVDSIRPRRVTWTDSSDSITRILTQVDTWELDNGASNWPSDRDIPIAWWETTLPQQQIGIAKTPTNNGVISLLYLALATTLTGAGVTFAVPDDWTPYILYGTLAELLSSDGPSFDPVRAGWCSQRFDEGVELAKIVIGGMS